MIFFWEYKNDNSGVFGELTIPHAIYPITNYNTNLYIVSEDYDSRIHKYNYKWLKNNSNLIFKGNGSNFDNNKLLEKYNLRVLGDKLYDKNTNELIKINKSELIDFSQVLR